MELDERQSQEATAQQCHPSTIKYGHPKSDDVTIPSSMHINELNVDCLAAILSKVPFQQQFKMLAVCTIWKVVIERLFESRLSLTLIDSAMNFSKYISQCFPEYCNEERAIFALKPPGSGLDDHVRFNDNHFGPAMAEWLGRRFPNVRQLVLHLEFDLDRYKKDPVG